eukprot:CAMPEP_0197667386 /NCGR_PEP_ID=MMETSP1338-20131121/66150_1 /TAXON_ID=43686 ORGANISM="Pelagodinium beii, Strain RCC1491" /NCGR_SAMPLE_ID=MMETSP1338 /ASSEMBLY_ACC=CAM_ASM_000754 /LENGTH=149 /DNA_ID=CAMNT_0043246603 /DNA_START=88 /DNA_END=539 /DNA_ORIENTATION=-
MVGPHSNLSASRTPWIKSDIVWSQKVSTHNHHAMVAYLLLHLLMRLRIFKHANKDSKKTQHVVGWPFTIASKGSTAEATGFASKPQDPTISSSSSEAQSPEALKLRQRSSHAVSRLYQGGVEQRGEVLQQDMLHEVAAPSMASLGLVLD